MEKLVLIDGNSLINRAFYAMPLLVTREGVPTNAVYGFMNMFCKMISDVKPKYIAVAFDLKAPTFRHKMYDGYKATRKPMPEELRPQIPLLKELLKKMGIAVFEKEGFEADDIIGTIAKATNIDTYIYTGDRDSFQLVDSETSVCFTKRGITDIDLLTNDNFTEKTGITPKQVIELKALMGDASDNIPGIPGVGEKTAISLIQDFHDIDGVYNNIDKITGKLKEKIINGKESCYLSKTLATIDINAPIDTDTEKMKYAFPFSQEIKKEFVKLEFKSIISRSELFNEIVEDKSEQITVSSNDIEVTKNNILTIKLGKELCVVLDETCVYIFDIKSGVEYKYKVHENLLDEGFLYGEIIDAIKYIFGKEYTLIMFSKKDTKRQLKNSFNVDLNAKVEDVSLIKYLVDFGGGEITINDLILSETGSDKVSATALYSIYTRLYELLKEQDVADLYYNIELPLSDVLYDMEEEGFKVNIDSLTETGKKYQNILLELEAQIREMVDEPTLNIKSPKQLGEVLFEKLKIGKGKKTKSGFSTSAEVLEELANEHPVIPLILKYRQIAKLNSTYVDGFKDLINKKTGLIHTSFNQTVTATGRLSSKEPNLQNIPIREEEGRELRRFFIPKNQGGFIVGADYSQIELRLLADFSKCDALIQAFKREEDVHAITASKVFNVPIDKVTKEMRRSAKAVNFGVIYGISEYGLAKNLHISPKEAKAYIDNYFSTYPEVKKYMEDNVNFAKENGYAKTLMGRRRYIRELKNPNFNLRSFGERVAMNMPLQGSSADIIKLAMINVYNRLKKEGLKSKLILQVHDELLLDVPNEEKETAKKILKEEMEGAVNLAVNLTVEVECGETWFDAK